MRYHGIVEGKKKIVRLGVVPSCGHQLTHSQKEKGLLHCSRKVWMERSVPMQSKTVMRAKIWCQGQGLLDNVINGLSINLYYKAATMSFACHGGTFIGTKPRGKVRIRVSYQNEKERETQKSEPRYDTVSLRRSE